MFNRVTFDKLCSNFLQISRLNSCGDVTVNKQFPVPWGSVTTRITKADQVKTNKSQKGELNPNKPVFVSISFG